MAIIYEFKIQNFTVQSGYTEFQVIDGVLELGAPPTPELAALIAQYGGKLKAEEEKPQSPFETQKFSGDDETSSRVKSKRQEAD